MTVNSALSLGKDGGWSSRGGSAVRRSDDFVAWGTAMDTTWNSIGVFIYIGVFIASVFENKHVTLQC